MCSDKEMVMCPVCKRVGKDPVCIEPDDAFFTFDGMKVVGHEWKIDIANNNGCGIKVVKEWTPDGYMYDCNSALFGYSSCSVRAVCCC